MMREKIILASQSQSRLSLLRGAGFDEVVQVPSGVDEEVLKKKFGAGESGAAGIEALALALAEAKALKVSGQHPKDWVIGADQILMFEGKPYDKSRDVTDAKKLFLAMRGKEHFLIGGQVIARGGKIVWRHSSNIRLVLRDFSDDLLEDYIKKMGDKILQAVGGYQLEGAAVQFFDSIEGDYFAILGLDLLPLLKGLRDLGAIRK